LKELLKARRANKRRAFYFRGVKYATEKRRLGRKSGVLRAYGGGHAFGLKSERTTRLERKALFPMRMTYLIGVLASTLVLAAAAPAAAGQKERIEALEAAVADLRASSATASASALRISELEQQIQTLTGRVEELTHELDQANAKIQSMTLAISGAKPASGGPAPLSGDPIADQIAGTTGAAAAGDIALPLDADAAYQYCADFLLNGDYARAQKAFELYLKAFPNHARTADAQFRLGEIYLATGANADAADAFIAHIKKYPSDPRAADAYLKLGTAFSRMKQSAEACKVFKTMKSKFPNASQAVMERADVEMAKISCR
jgi:tol-pal system protein YbgF